MLALRYYRILIWKGLTEENKAINDCNLGSMHLDQPPLLPARTGQSALPAATRQKQWKQMSQNDGGRQVDSYYQQQHLPPPPDTPMPFPCLKIDQHLAISGFSFWDERKWNKKRRLFWFFTQTNNKQCCVRRQNQSKGRNYANVPREEWRRCWWEDDRWPPPEVLSIETDHAGLHSGRQQGAILSYAVSAVMCTFTLILGTIRVSAFSEEDFQKINFHS